MRRQPPFFAQDSVGGSDYMQGPLGPSSLSVPDERRYAKVLATTGTTSSTGQPAYCWREIRFDNAGQVSNFATGLASGGVCSTIAGTLATGYAYELAGRADVPTGTIIEIYPAGTVGTAGDEWYFIWAVGSPIFKDDKGGSVTSIVHKVNNSVVTNVAGEAVTTIDDTSATAKGLVNLANQVMGDGEKYFQDPITAAFTTGFSPIPGGPWSVATDTVVNAIGSVISTSHVGVYAATNSLFATVANLLPRGGGLYVVDDSGIGTSFTIQLNAGADISCPTGSAYVIDPLASFAMSDGLGGWNFGVFSATDQAGNTIKKGLITAVATDGFSGTGTYTSFTFLNGRCTAAAAGTGTIGTSQIADGAVTEAKQTLADVATWDVDATRHGYAPKAPGNAAKFLDGTGAWSDVDAADVPLTVNSGDWAGDPTTQQQFNDRIAAAVAGLLGGTIP